MLLSSARGRGRSFENSLPPSQPQVGGVLSRHWHAWLSCGAEEWTVRFLWDVYRVPFHHLPPVSQVPTELSSAAPGTVRALALQEEVNKMVPKGVVEIIQQLRPGFYSHLFLVEKMTRGWRPVIDLSSLNNFVTITKFRMEAISSVLASVCRGDWMFSVALQDTYFQTLIHKESRLYLCFCLEGCVYQLKALCFGLSTAPQVFTRVFALVSEGHVLSSLPGQLAGGCGIEGPPSSSSDPASPVMLRPRHCGQLEEVRPHTVDLSSVHRDDSRHDPRTGVSIPGSSVMIPGGGHIIFPTRSSSSSHVTAPPRPHVVVGTVSSGGAHSHETPPVADEGSLITSGRRPILPAPPVSRLCPGNQVVAQ